MIDHWADYDVKQIFMSSRLRAVAVSAAQVYKSYSEDAAAAIEIAPTNNDFVTQTVYGFLDFTTTIGNTVMVFSPQSAPPGNVCKILFINYTQIIMSDR